MGELDRKMKKRFSRKKEQKVRSRIDIVCRCVSTFGIAVILGVLIPIFLSVLCYGLCTFDQFRVAVYFTLVVPMKELIWLVAAGQSFCHVALIVLLFSSGLVMAGTIRRNLLLALSGSVILGLLWWFMVFTSMFTLRC